MHGYRLCEPGTSCAAILGAFEAEDDKRALEIACRSGVPRPFELWCGNRKVLQLSADGSVDIPDADFS